MRERSGVSRKANQQRKAPQRRSGARAKADVLPELSDLIIRFFFSEVEAALRAALQEVLGRPPASKFTVHLENTPEEGG